MNVAEKIFRNYLRGFVSFEDTCDCLRSHILDLHHSGRFSSRMALGYLNQVDLYVDGRIDTDSFMGLLAVIG